jgi:D-alanyl-D-alanine carboxypeptidase
MPPNRRRRTRRRRFPTTAILVTLVGAAALAWLLAAACGPKSSKNGSRSSATTATKTSATPATAISSGTAPSPPATPESAGAFAPAPPTPEPTCAPEDMLRLVTKEIALPAEYMPADLVTVQPLDASPSAAIPLKLRREADESLHRMLEQARTGGLSIIVQSAFRGYQDQQQVYQEEVKTFGQAQADRESARAGHSEHQLGVAVDFSSKRLNYDLNDSFAATAEGKWLAQNAAQYGFVLSYPDGKEAITGYMYEPWHYRYIGSGPAQAVRESGITLNEWLLPRQVGCRPT